MRYLCILGEIVNASYATAIPRQRPSWWGRCCVAAAVVHRAFGWGAVFLLCAFATDFLAPAFARARAALLAAARLSGDHGVYRNSGWPIDLMYGPFVLSGAIPCELDYRCYAAASIFSISRGVSDVAYELGQGDANFVRRVFLEKMPAPRRASSSWSTGREEARKHPATLRRSDIPCRCSWRHWNYTGRSEERVSSRPDIRWGRRLRGRNDQKPHRALPSLVGKPTRPKAAELLAGL